MGWLCAAAVVHGGQAGNNDDNCPMRAPRIERKERLSQAGVLSVSLSKDRLRAAMLLNDGYAIQIYHYGCEHVGFDATRWMDELPKTQAMQLQVIRQLIKTALPAIELQAVALKESDFRVTVDGNRILYSHTKDDLYAEFNHRSNGRYLLSVTYALPY
jgi:hypothetical protein